MEITSLLQDLLPGASDCQELAQQAGEINALYVAGEISAEERDSLLRDLANTRVIQQAANSQDQQILLDQVCKLLMAAPLPS